MKISTFYNNHLQNGNIHGIGFALIGITLGALLGAGYGAFSVLHSEQTESGRYATYGECVRAICYTDSDGASCDCKNFENVVVPLGVR